MTRTLRDYFPPGAGPHEQAVFKGMTGTYRFDVEGQRSVRVEVGDGVFTVTESSAPADCVIRLDEGDVARIASGEQNLITATLQGRARIEGDFALAQKFHGLVRAGRPAA